MGIYNIPLTLEWTPQVWDQVIDPYASGMLYILLIENIVSLLNKFQTKVTALIVQGFKWILWLRKKYIIYKINKKFISWFYA